jgi:hypothetical protein
MKFDPKKLFGYPVLRNSMLGENRSFLDYPKGEFQPDIKLKIDPRDKGALTVEYEVAISVPELIAKVKEKKAGFKLSISCPKTFWSQTFDIAIEGEIVIASDNLKDQVELSITLVSLMDFEFASEKFHSDFSGETFDIAKNSILAWHAPFIYTIEKEQFRSLRSLIDIRSDENTPEGYITFNGDGDYVTVTVHPNMKESIGLATQASDISRATVFSSFYQSVVCQMLMNMIRIDEDSDDDLSNRRWTSIIEQKCKKEKIGWRTEEAMASNAQLLLGNGMKRISILGFGAKR